jgi:hypothetical protein
MRSEIAFNGRERPVPLLDQVLIKALEKWIRYRIEKGWGVTSAGYLTLSTFMILISMPLKIPLMKSLEKMLFITLG